MKLKFLKTAIVGLVLSVNGFANAALITSEADASLASSTLIDFETFSSGLNSPQLSFAGGVITANNNTVSTDTFNNYGSTGVSLVNWNTNGFTISFDSNVSAFGISIGAHDSVWTFSAYDNGDNLLESLTTLTWPQIGIENGEYLGFKGYPISYVTLNSSGDVAVFDHLRFTNSNEIPEPSTLAIFALGMIGLASRRSKKQS